MKPKYERVVTLTRAGNSWVLFAGTVKLLWTVFLFTWLIEEFKIILRIFLIRTRSLRDLRDNANSEIARKKKNIR